MQEIIHSLKGSSGNIGAEYLHSYTSKLLSDLNSGHIDILSMHIVDELRKEVDTLEEILLPA